MTTSTRPALTKDQVRLYHKQGWLSVRYSINDSTAQTLPCPTM